MKNENHNSEIQNRIDDIYHETRIHTSMMIFIIIMNLLLLCAGFLGFLIWLDSTPKIG